MTERCEPPPELRERIARAIHEGLGESWAYCNYGGDEWNSCRYRLDDAADEVLAIVTPPAVVAALVEALEGWTNALDAKREFERQSPGNSTKAWDRLFYAVEAAETEARAALTLYREAGR